MTEVKVVEVLAAMCDFVIRVAEMEASLETDLDEILSEFWDNDIALEFINALKTEVNASISDETKEKIKKLAAEDPEKDFHLAHLPVLILEWLVVEGKLDAAMGTLSSKCGATGRPSAD